MPKTWSAGRFKLTPSPHSPLIMGIVNVTPDSFSDGGQHNTASAAIAHAETLLKEGADILDLGGESTRPGSQGVSVEEEWARLAPVLKALVPWNVPLSVDTLKPEIMRRAVEVGVDILNDVNGFRAPGAEETLAASTVGGVVMHMLGEPRTMQASPQYADVVREVTAFLQDRLTNLEQQGVGLHRLMVDPGFGFGKTLAHNVSLMQATAAFSALGAGVLIGVSRKRMIGELTGIENPPQRIHGSIAAALFAAREGAAVVRVHDVKATRDALQVQAVLLGG
ncbi:dihydropteroate synthase [Limnobacter humi]|uniref:Dihydropteroate synthase n=1 Tax=Limnobacter humi TaxID=1778671 RepID=A0ABT1WIC7_9BURK|nr:dihydropteroate synthase [Limnobacter humi]MCQ8896796.1 dihydropteroate synthase [Limnobacter humi]